MNNPTPPPENLPHASRPASDYVFHNPENVPEEKWPTKTVATTTTESGYREQRARLLLVGEMERPPGDLWKWIESYKSFFVVGLVDGSKLDHRGTYATFAPLPQWYLDWQKEQKASVAKAGNLAKPQCLSDEEIDLCRKQMCVPFGKVYLGFWAGISVKMLLDRAKHANASDLRVIQLEQSIETLAKKLTACLSSRNDHALNFRRTDVARIRAERERDETLTQLLARVEACNAAEEELAVVKQYAGTKLSNSPSFKAGLRVAELEDELTAAQGQLRRAREAIEYCLNHKAPDDIVGIGINERFEAVLKEAPPPPTPTVAVSREELIEYLESFLFEATQWRINWLDATGGVAGKTPKSETIEKGHKFLTRLRAEAGTKGGGK